MRTLTILLACLGIAVLARIAVSTNQIADTLEAVSRPPFLVGQNFIPPNP